MSLKAELESWSKALKAYDAESYEEALEIFTTIAESSKIWLNCGMIYATIGDHDAAIQQFVLARQADPYLAIAYFQAGVSNFILGQYDAALQDFDDCYLYLRENEAIYYEQLGLNFKLYSAEVLFNRGLTRIFMGSQGAGMSDLEQARRLKVTPEHSVIDDAIRDGGEDYTVFSMPVGALFRPNEKKIKSVAAKDYLGKAKLIAASDSGDVTTEFSGIARKRAGITPQGVFVDTANNSSVMRSQSANVSPSDRAVPPADLGRSNTALGINTDVPRALQAGVSPPSAFRSPNSGTRGPALPRTPSMKRPQQGHPPRASPASPSPPPRDADKEPPRQSDYLADILDSYGDDGGDGVGPPKLPPLPPIPNGKGMGMGGMGGMGGGRRSPPQPARSLPPPSVYAPSSVSSGLRRGMSRRGDLTRSPSSYYPGATEYDYEERPFEMVKIRVKMHYREDLRGMTLVPEASFEEFLERVSMKFGTGPNKLDIKFKDEDGGRVSLMDESDYELAIETAREHARGRPEGKLEIWCTHL